jgi:hypothetical protein
LLARGFLEFQESTYSLATEPDAFEFAPVAQADTAAGSATSMLEK